MADNYTWAGDPATRRVVAPNDDRGPDGMTYQQANDGGFYKARDAATGDWLWVKSGEMRPLDTTGQQMVQTPRGDYIPAATASGSGYEALPSSIQPPTAPTPQNQTGGTFTVGAQPAQPAGLSSVSSLLRQHRDDPGYRPAVPPGMSPSATGTTQAGGGLASVGIGAGGGRTANPADVGSMFSHWQQFSPGGGAAGGGATGAPGQAPKPRRGWFTGQNGG